MSITPARLWLAGLMGAGKTTVGHRTAALLGWPYRDNDDELARVSGRTLADWSRDGEPAAALHAAERSVVVGLARQPPPLVASVAASVADTGDDLLVLRHAGVLVYLHAPLDVLAARVAHTGRPLGNDPAHVLGARATQRDRAFRSAAALCLDTSTTDPDACAAAIRRLLTS